jgi:protease stability complex PrcB-like protein
VRNGCSVLAVLVAVWCGASAAAPVTLTTIDRGQQSNIDNQGEVIVRTAAQWTTLWRRHAPEGQPRPAVDFTKSTVVAVFLGSRSTGGYSVEITGIEREGSDLIVTYREQRPDPGAMLAQVLTMPYHIVRIKRFAGPIRFTRAQ